MIKGKQKVYQEIDEKFILDKISTFDIFKFYTPGFKLGQAFSSPFRKDNSPSCIIKISKDTGLTYYWDLSEDSTLNCFKYVKKLFGINYNDALRKICSDMGLTSDSTRNYKQIVSQYEQPIITKDYQRFDVFTRKFTHEEANYWNLRYLSTDDLKGGYIFSYSKLLIDGVYIPKPNGLISFGFYYPSLNGWKIYTPHADKKKGERKWLTNIPLSHIEGLSSLSKDKLSLGTKSRKDCLITKKFIPNIYECQNESKGSIIPENIDYIIKNSSDAYLWFDNDQTGVESCTYYNQFGLKYVNIPKTLLVKDQDEMVVTYGMDYFEKFLKEKKLI